MADRTPVEPKSAPPKGPASYFPSIEKTYGRLIDDWIALVRSRPGKLMCTASTG